MEARLLAVLLLLAIIAFSPLVGFAQALIDERALKLVSQFSYEVCGPYENASVMGRVDIDGGVKAKITGLLKPL